MNDHASREPEKLETWKQIAGYLDVSDRTAQEWERTQGLPVRRMGSGPRARVWALKADLDAWMQGQQQAVKQPVRESRKRRNLILHPVAVGVIAVFLGISNFWPQQICNPQRVAVDGMTLQAIDHREVVCWSRKIPDLYSAYYWPEAPSYLTRVDDYDQTTEENEVLFLASTRGPDACLTQKLYLFDRSGQPLWERDPTGPVPETGRDFQECYGGRIEVVENGSETLLVALAEQHPYYPSRLVVYDLQGNMRGDYWHPGRPSHEAFSVGPGRETDETLLWIGGTNNPEEGLGTAFVAVLPLPFPDGPTMSQESASKHFFGPLYAIEKAYMFFPEIDVFSEQSMRTAVDKLTVSREWAQIAVGAGGQAGRVHFKINHDFEIVDCRISDDLRTAHRRAYVNGILDHELTPEEEASWCRAWRSPTAIDGNRQALHESLPEVVQASDGHP